MYLQKKLEDLQKKGPKQQTDTGKKHLLSSTSYVQSSVPKQLASTRKMMKSKETWSEEKMKGASTRKMMKSKETWSEEKMKGEIPPSYVSPPPYTQSSGSKTFTSTSKRMEGKEIVSTKK